MTIVERIKKLCESRKITIAELERRTDLKNSTIYRWDTNKPSIDKIQKVADYFDVSIDYLLGRNDEAEFQAFINDPELYVWYKELPSREEELQDLRELWELMKKTRDK